jgi:hypothetical protein
LRKLSDLYSRNQMVWGDFVRGVEALASLSTSKQAGAEPVAWMRKWAFDNEAPYKVPNLRGRLVLAGKFKMLPVTKAKIFDDDIALSAAPSAGDSADAPVQQAGDWGIDHSAGRPILVHKNCSVIEAEDAKYVLRLIAADRAATDTLSESERAELERLRGLINTPHTDDFFEAINLEAAHQIERFGDKRDQGKTPTDWLFLIGYLAGKAATSFIRGDTEKGKHHIVSSGAVLLNWWRHVTGAHTEFRPGRGD